MAYTGGENLNVHREVLQLMDQFGVQKLKWRKEALLLVDQREVHEEELARMREGD